MIAHAPFVVLHQAQLGENIGMAARAMANCGLSELRLSAPRAGWDREKAEAASKGAKAIIEHLRVTENLPTALADCQRVYATSARRRDMSVRVIDAETAAQEIHASQGRVALLFGAENSGLDNDAISLADAVIEIPLHPDCTSLNLSQAVLLVAYAWWQKRADVALETPSHIPARREEAMYFLGRLESGLEQQGFFTDQHLRPVMWRNIQAMFHRAQFTSQEVQTWHGIITALLRR